jgi:hypothetical protein
MTDSNSYFTSLGVPGDDPGTPAKDGAVPTDTVELYVMGQMLYSIPWFSGWLNDGISVPPPTPYLDLVVQPVLTISSTAGGSTSPTEGTYEDVYVCEETVPIVATAEGGFNFVNWTATTTEAEDAIGDVNSPSTSITMNGIYSIQANFASTADCTLNVDVIGTGSVTEPATSPTSVPCGDPIDLLAVETDPCWEFSGWTADTTEGYNAIDDPSAADTFITMNGDYSIHANFTLKQVELTTASTAGGSVTTPGELGPYQYNCGQQVPIVATATGCYNFTGWTGDTGTIADTGAASTTITMDDNYSITANFELASELVDVEITFNVGWNTFSTPISLHDCVDTWAEFIAANSLVIEMIYGYDSATESWVTVNPGDEIEPLYGFYIKVSEAGIAHIIPNANETSLPIRDLSSGVNLIGPAPASLGDVDVVTALVTIYWAEVVDSFQPTGYTLVVSPYVNSPNAWSYARDALDPPMMNIGRAYWVVMDNADKYVGETTTPVVP